MNSSHSPYLINPRNDFSSFHTPDVSASQGLRVRRYDAYQRIRFMYQAGGIRNMLERDGATT